MNAILVGLGGAIGSIARYKISLITIKLQYPLMTLLVNIVGAIIIGFVTELYSSNKLSDKQSLFLKTGICGGFTTFSTFSLESLSLLEQGKYIHGYSYMFISVFLCIFGVFIGKLIAVSIKKYY